MALVTVLTPTYNRGANLEDLYLSLQSQTNIDFEWLIIDDGSADDTAQRAARFSEQANFRVRYIRKENGGKHTALNVGVRSVTTELTFIVDSDDTVFPECIATIEYFYHKYKDHSNVGVWSFLKCDIDRGILVKMPEDEFVGSYVKDRIRESRPGDMAEVFLTKALREFPFPEFGGEKFLSEDVVWIPLGLKYQTVFVNLPIYRFAYLHDGLTRNDKRHKFASPLGSMMRGKMLMKRECGLKANIRGAIIYGCYKREASQSLPECVWLRGLKERFLAAALFPVSLIFNRKWKAQADAQE